MKAALRLIKEIVADLLLQGVTDPSIVSAFLSRLAAVTMGRFETLNDETKDLVECILPPLASSFSVSDVVYIIPEDIRMRQWDVDRRDHIKDKTENDPRNWGVQFLKDLKTIARLTNGDLAKFQIDLREKVALHEDKHPWARLADIKEIRLDYENPGRKERLANPAPASSDGSSTDSYFEELVEPDHPRGSKRKAGRHEVYEARIQKSFKHRKSKPDFQPQRHRS